jgi:arabinose-5-phosphate isomerase
MHAEPAVRADAVRAGVEAIEIARLVIERLGDRFEASAATVIDLVLASPGRVIVSGLGKSGLVGAKLAATLTSTGTPSHFVHAADALHGDAGVLMPGDVLLAISNSGRTAEVVALATLAAARGIPVIAMSGCQGGSPLAEIATVHLDISVEREADPHDLAPTASTTATIVLGDAIAVALMVARGFGPVEFHAHHPAGALGLRLASGGAVGG